MNGFASGRVLARREWARGLITLRVAAEIEPFTPGQFVNLGLEVQGTFLRRAYSLASPPGESLEFYVREVEHGDFSPVLFGLQPGAPIWVERKAQGFFTLAYVPACAELWLVASGTGLGPFMSMLRSAEPWQRFEELVLVHAARVPEDLSYRDELAALSQSHAGRLRYIPVLSRGHGYDAIEGRVTHALADGRLEARAGHTLEASRSHVMLCGNPAMIAELSELLATRGLSKHRQRKPGQISAEKYW